MGSVSTVLTMGFGSWGSVNLLPTLGFGIGEAPEASGRILATVSYAVPHQTAEYAVPDRSGATYSIQ